MTEDEAQSWVRAEFGVPRETLLRRYAELLVAESGRQNLISASTLGTLWVRHIVDSAQLAVLASRAPGTWIDIGSGAGLPGMVVAILSDREVVLCEPRARRAQFLESVAKELGLAGRIHVAATKIETFRAVRPAGIISARAVAELSQLLRSAVHCADLSTIWLLPKGRNAQSEVDAARQKWQGVFHVEPSITQPDSGIVVARGIQPR